MKKRSKSLSGYYSYEPKDVKDLFREIFQTKTSRVTRLNYIPSKYLSFLPEDWYVTAYVDGPVTFVMAYHERTKEAFTGWSKFNPNDKQYTQIGGLNRALVRAVDKYFSYIMEEELNTNFVKAWESLDKNKSENNTTSFMASVDPWTVPEPADSVSEDNKSS